MKKRSYGFIAIVAVLVITFVALVVFGLKNKESEKIDYSKYDPYSFIEGNDDNGGIADHVKGDLDKAKVVIYEYADFQCPGCAGVNPRVNTLLKEYDGKLAIIYRNYLLSYHQNGTAAASAAEAAGLQGYWKDYADMLFSNQSTWEYASADERTGMFIDLFREVTNNSGDYEKFQSDMKSKEVSKKLSFDQGMGKIVDIQGTPSFYLDGEKIDFSNATGEEDFLKVFRDKIDEKLKNKS
ncbi:MAG: thioredoxin domain-containing protein [Candidatus Saccharibacteria bacterium]|nr:thioredoxin domain-containing protein [Candidatus Saccharibacteria bacterium]